MYDFLVNEVSNGTKTAYVIRNWLKGFRTYNFISNIIVVYQTSVIVEFHICVLLKCPVGAAVKQSSIDL